MKIKTILSSFLIVLLYSSAISQTQYGFLIGGNLINLNSDDLVNVKSKIGYGIGISRLSSLHNSADFIAEITYTNKFMNVDEYKNFNHQEVEFTNKSFKREDINLNLIYNQYLIIPDLQKLNLSLQAGLGISFLNNWSLIEGNYNTLLDDKGGPLVPIIIAGISTGTEKLRLSIRYSIELSNTLKGIYVNDIPDEYNNYDSREFFGKQSNITFTLTYFINNFNF